MTRQHIAQSSTKREQRETKRKQQQRKTLMQWGGLGIVALVVIGGLIWFFTRPTDAAAAQMGDVIPVTSRDHIPEGTDPGAYSTNPPAGGHHFPTTFNPGFYTDAEVAKMPQYPQGYLVHDMEHGYVIYWYNCQADPSINCADMQNAIKQVIQENNTFKVIGFPWPSQKEPLVITSWGRILRLNKVDLVTMRAFYKANVDKGPEQTPN
jgi:hypothetical protein